MVNLLRGQRGGPGTELRAELLSCFAFGGWCVHMHPTEMYLKETHAQVGLGEWWGSERRGRGGAQYCARKRKPGEEVPAEKPLWQLLMSGCAGQRLIPQRKLVCRFKSCLFKSRKKH